MMDDCVDFIAQYSWLVNFKVTNFFIDRVWENAPAEWLEVFKTLSYEDLKGVPYGQIKDSWPDSLKVFIAEALKYSLPRERQAFKGPGGKWDSEPYKPVSAAEIHHDIRKGMTEKKLYEVCHLASLVNAVVTDSHADFIVDVGSGLGYLGQVLHSVYNQSVLGLEGEQSHASGAEKRGRKNYADSPFLQNRTCELYPSPESESNFKIVLSDWLSSLPQAGTQNYGSASLTGTQNNCSASLARTQNTGSASTAGTQNNCSASLAGTQNTGSASTAGTQNNGSASLSGTQNNGSASLAGTQNTGSTSTACTQNNGSASLSGTQNNGSASLSVIKNNGSQTKEKSGSQNTTSQSMNSMEQYEFENRSDTSCSKESRYSDGGADCCSYLYETSDKGDHDFRYRQEGERIEFSVNSVKGSKNVVQQKRHQLQCFEERKQGEEKEVIDSKLENVQEQDVDLFSECVTATKNEHKEQVNSCSEDGTKIETENYSDCSDLGCNTVTYGIDANNASEQEVMSFSKCVSVVRNTSKEQVIDVLQRKPCICSLNQAADTRFSLKSGDILFSENTKTCTISDSTDLCGNTVTDLRINLTLSQQTQNSDDAKLTYLPPVCMIGLHCCGDLTPTMLKYFTKMQFIKALCVVSCCYHRMEYKEEEQRLTNFPLSSSLLTCLSRTRMLHPGFNFTPYSMRLAAQETRARWKSQSPEDHNYHMRNVAYRGILELALNDGPFTLKKTSRKLVHNDDYISFDRYVTTVSKNIQALSKESAAEQNDSFQEKMKQLYDEYEEYFAYIEPITSLQFLLQPVLESLIYKDRLTWLQEQGFDDDAKLTYLPPVCMIGLHCCGDLTPTMLKYFTKMQFIKALCVVSCCYHRMEYKEEEQRLTNFPLSSSLLTCLSRTRMLHPGFNFTPYSMRLAAQETRARWKSQSPEDHNYHKRNVAYRGILELALNDGPFTLKKTSRKLVHNDDYISFDRYVTTVSKNIQALSKESAAEQNDSFQEKMKQLYDEYEEYFAYIEPITSLQFLLQPVLESLIYKDRLTWLQEQGFDGDIVPIFDEIVSPRNLALIAIKR